VTASTDPPKLIVFPSPLYNACDSNNDESKLSSRQIGVLYIYIYIPTQQSLPQQTHLNTMANQTAVATLQYKSFSTFVSAGPGDSKLMFRLIHFWEACNNSKGDILIGTKYVTVDFFNDHHPHRLSHSSLLANSTENSVKRVVDMIAYHEHAGEASNSHPPMLDAVSNEFWEQKIVRKSNGADISRLQRNVKKRDMLGLYKDGFEREKACVFKLSHKNLRVIDEDMKIEERTLWEIKQVITLGLMFTNKSLSKQIKLLRRFMTWCFFV
ncbi:hypothetical protein HID58_073009, partial [Brassica napus]